MDAILETMRTSQATNVQVAEAIGMTHSGVSRIRSGDRLPSIDVMVNIEKAYGWGISAQVAARRVGNYAECFETLLVNKYGVANEVHDVPTTA